MDIAKITEDVWEIYSSEVQSKNDYAIFEDAAIPLTTIAELLQIECHCSNRETAVSFFMSRYLVRPEMQEKVAEAARNILRFGSENQSARSSQFLSQCAKLQMLMYKSVYDNYAQPLLPRSSINSSALIDMASGPDFTNFFQDLQPTTMYYAVDMSYFAVEYIRQKAEMFGIKNVITINKNVMEVKRRDIGSGLIEIIRAKNIFMYVPTYLYVFKEHLSWLDDRGRFIFAEQASDAAANKSFQHELLKNNFSYWLNNGWGFEYYFGDIKNPLDLNNVILLKNSCLSIKENLDKLSNFYNELNERYPDLIGDQRLVND